MSFNVSKEGDFVSLECPEKDRAILSIPEYESESGKREYFILDSDLSPITYDNSDETDIPEPYFDIEQALDDFEYETEELPAEVIQEFKDNIKACKSIDEYAKDSQIRIGTANRTDLFNVVQEDNRVSILYPIKDRMLNCINGTEYSITDTSLEPIPDYESIAKNFTDDMYEALNYFEALVGHLPEDVISEFESEVQNLALSDNDKFVIINEDGKVLSYTGDDNDNVDFLDTVDDKDGGYAKAVKFETEQEAMNCIATSELPVGEYDVLSTKDAFNFVETSEDDEACILIDEDGKVLSYIDTNDKSKINFIDTVDDEDGGYSRAVIFKNRESAEKSIKGSWLEEHYPEVIPVNEAFMFIEDNE